MSQEPCTLFWPRSGFTPDALAADVAGGHGEVGDCHHRGRALAVLGDAEAVIDRPIASGRIKPRRLAQLLGINASGCGGRLRRIALVGHEARPGLETLLVAALAHVALVDEAFGDHDMGHCVQDRNVGSGPQRQMMVGFDMRAPHQIDPARVDDDEARAGAQTAF